MLLPILPKNPRFVPRMGYEKPGLGDDPAPDPTKAACLAYAKFAGQLLEKHYPGHPWAVEASIAAKQDNGILKFRLIGLMPHNRWYIIHLKTLTTDPGGRCIIKGGGELLERYKLARAPFSLEQFRNAMDQTPIYDRIRGKGHVAPLLD